MRKNLFIFLWLIAIILSFSVATETFAYLVEYDPLLGEKHFIYIYEPFHIISWIITLEATGNQLYIAGGVFIFFFLFFSILLFILYVRKKLKKSTLHGSERWGETREMKKYIRPKKDGIILAMVKEAKIMKKGDKYYLKVVKKLIRSIGSFHVFICAFTRGGKGINNIITTLLSWMGSVIVHDMKGENYKLTGGWRGLFSHLIPFEPLNPDSPAYNPLFDIRPGNRLVSDTQNLVEVLSDPFGKKETSIWTTTAKSLLVASIIHILLAGKPEEKNLPFVYRLLASDDKIKIFKRMKNTLHLGDRPHPVVEDMAQAMLNLKDAPKQMLGYIDTARQWLTLFADEVVSKLVSRSDFTIDDMMYRDNPVSMYIIIPSSDQDRLTPLTRLIIQQFNKRLTENEDRANTEAKHWLLEILDEFPNLGYMAFFEKFQAQCVAYKIRLMIVTQSINNIKQIYGDKSMIVENCQHKVFLGAADLPDMEYISKLLGNETVEKESISNSGGKENFTAKSDSTSTTLVARPLMTPQEVKRMDYRNVIVDIKGKYPYLAKKNFFFLDKQFKRKLLPKPSAEDIWKHISLLRKNRKKSYWEYLEPISAEIDEEEIIKTTEEVSEGEVEDNNRKNQRENFKSFSNVDI